MSRRDLICMVGASTGLAILSRQGVSANRRRWRVRRRIRRVAVTRLVFGRPFWVVPVAVTAGWELTHEERVVVVKETRIVERHGTKTEVAIVQDASGHSTEVEILRDDTEVNATNLPGSEIEEGDTTTPGIEVESTERGV